MTDVEIIDILNKYNRFLNEKCELLNNKVLNNYLEEFTINNFNNCSQCKALTWNNGKPKQCKSLSVIGHFCKTHSKLESKECKHCLTHYKKRIKHKYRWECLGTIDIQSNGESLDSYIKKTFDSIDDSQYDEIDYEELIRMITSKYTDIDYAIIKQSVDTYVEERC